MQFRVIGELEIILIGEYFTPGKVTAEAIEYNGVKKLRVQGMVIVELDSEMEDQFLRGETIVTGLGPAKLDPRAAERSKALLDTGIRVVNYIEGKEPT